MKIWKYAVIVVGMIAAINYAQVSLAAISSEEAAKLGTTLTGVGAEMAGNKDGTIPPYTGGLTTPPPTFKPGSGIRPDPFENERPLFSISAENVEQYADKLTEGTNALIKRKPGFRIDVYKTHRTVAFPESVLKNTKRNAVTATTYNGGLSVKGTRAGYPFPIPKDGYETMWNHLLSYKGRAYEYEMQGWLVPPDGRKVMTVKGHMWHEIPYYDEDTTRYDANIYWKFRWLYTGPPRKAGEDMFVFDPINIGEEGRIVWQYLPGQRRVKLAPEIAFDTPNAGPGGANTYDDYYLFNGSMERYDFKLLGKKEIYVPYNEYKIVYMTKDINKILGSAFVNPDVMRWELHRVWVVEGTLKKGKRHIYHKRRFYLDEDSWNIIATENYDGLNNLFRIGFGMEAPSYDFPAPSVEMHMFYDMIAGCYNINVWLGQGYMVGIKPFPEKYWSPDALAGRGLR